MHTFEPKTRDVYDLADPKASTRSQFRDDPYCIVLESADRLQLRAAELRIKDMLTEQSMPFRGPRPQPRARSAGGRRVGRHKSVFMVGSSTYQFQERLMHLVLSHGVRASINFDLSRYNFREPTTQS